MPERTLDAKCVAETLQAFRGELGPLSPKIIVIGSAALVLAGFLPSADDVDVAAPLELCRQLGNRWHQQALSDNRNLWVRDTVGPHEATVEIGHGWPPFNQRQLAQLAIRGRVCNVA